MSDVRVMTGRWADSAKLMAAARQAEAVDGVERALCFMGTPANRDQARELGFTDPSLDGAGPDDLVIAASGPAASDGVAAALAVLDAVPAASGPAEARPARTLANVDADLAIISVPGEYAVLEAHIALGRGMDVLLFSDGVSATDELALKQRAHLLGRLVMGPGAGTAIIDGVGLGFANVVARGKVGVVAAAGTGAQEATVLLDDAGVGVSQCYGTGGHDLHADIGAITMLDAIARLAKDPETDVILCVSKPPAPAVAERVLAALAACGKPAAACFVGAPDLPHAPGVRLAHTLDQAVAAAATLAGGHLEIPVATAPGTTTGFVRGLFSGGTLCAEAAAILAEALGALQTNAPAGRATALAPGEQPTGHTCIDLGEEEYTRGRPHPMIDPAARAELLATVAADPTVGLILLDVVIGHASHADPAGAIIPAITAARMARPDLIFVGHVLGTEADPQVRSRQVRALTDAGVHLASTNAVAAQMAALAVAH